MSCAFAPWSGVVSSKSCKWTWWLQLLQPQMGFLGCRQKLWSCTDELFFSDTPPISVCDIYQASIHPSNQPLSNSTYLCLCEGPSLGVSSHLVVSHQASIPSPPTDSYMDDLEPDFSLKKSQVSTGEHAAFTQEPTRSPATPVVRIRQLPTEHLLFFTCS